MSEPASKTDALAAEVARLRAEVDSLKRVSRECRHEWDGPFFSMTGRGHWRCVRCGAKETDDGRLILP